jgi:hypothetical protein
MQPGEPAREDTEYVRCSVADVMFFCEPDTGHREAQVTERRIKTDFARAMERIVETYPDADVIRVVMDDLNTHKPGSLYETFLPDKTNFLLKMLEFH